MGEEGKRWSVTYTKHVNRKRKVYHDGFLLLLPDNNKLKLYDESQQVVESMFLTKHDAAHLHSGNSIQFPSFLVDVGDVQPQTHPQSQHENTIHTTFFANTLPKKTSSINLSPSHNFIKEFKKKQLLKYSMHQSPTTAPSTPSFQEWEALYTSQITKKSKKYHDGFLRMLICGSRQRQIVLYDLNKNQLDKRFLKKDEIIGEGESMTFDSYLVEIGSSVGESANNTDVKMQGTNCKLTDEREKVAASYGSFGGHPQQDACSDTPIVNLHSLKVDEMDVRKRLPSHTPLRDAYQILSILKKPVAQDRRPVVEKTPAKQCQPQNSESVELDGLCKDVEGSLAVPIDRPLAATTESKDRKVANEGYQLEVEDYDLPNPAVNAGNKIEIAASSQQVKAKSNAVESSIKTEQVEFSQCSRPYANSDHTLPTSTVADFIISLPSVSKESEAYQDQLLASIPESDMPSEEELPQDVSRTKCSSEDPDPTEMGNSAKVAHLRPILDYPSFDLGF